MVRAHHHAPLQQNGATPSQAWKRANRAALTGLRNLASSPSVCWPVGTSTTCCAWSPATLNFRCVCPVLPGRPIHLGHQHGVGQVGVLAQQVGVAGRGEHGAARDLLAGQAGAGGQLLGLGDESRRAKARLEELEGGAPLTPYPSPGGRGAGNERAGDPRPSLLVVRQCCYDWYNQCSFWRAFSVVKRQFTVA